MKLMKIGPIVLLLVGLARCQQRVQGASQQASSAWSQSAQRNNQVYQSRDLATSNQPSNNNQHQVETVEYYDDDEYYEDEPSTPLKDEHQQREAKSSKTDKTSNGTIYEDAYYYDDDYEDENVSTSASQKPIEPSTTTSTTTTTTTTTSEKPVVTTIKNEVTTKIDVVPSSTSTTTTTEKAKIQEEDEEPSSILIGEAIVSVVTTKSVVNGTFSVPELTTLPPMEPTKDMSETNTSSTTTTTSTTTEGTTTSTTTTTETAPSSTTIQASVQTGRSVSGARFLPFPSVVDKVEQLDSTESIIDKLDRVQSELSSGFLSNSRFVPRRYNKKPFSATSLTLPTTSTVAPTSSPIAPITITSITKRPRVQTTLDDIAAFLPKDFPKSSLFKTTTTTVAPSTKRPKFQTTLDDVEAFLPKDFPKSSYRTSTTKRPKLQTTLDDLDGFLPKDYPKSGGYRSGSFKRPSYKTSTTVSSSTTTTTAKVAAASSTTTEKSTASTRPKTLTTIEDISAFLPPGYKLKKEDATTEKSVLLSEILAKTSVKPKEGSTLSPSTTERAKSIQDLFAKSSLDISALLPPGYKAAETSSPKPSSTEKPAPNVPIQELFAKSSVDISALLPPGYKPAETKTNDDESTSTSSSTTTEKTNGSFKVVFPSRPGGGTRKPIHKITTPSSRLAGGGGGGAVSEPAIKKGWPVRATTEFTGWPTSSTTPISIEKLLEAARTATVSSLNISVFPTTSEEITSTSTTTTTTTTTIRPTTPGICMEECEVAGTIKIVENAVWVPELLDRNTREWQDLAEEIEREMNLVFAKSQVLRKWFRNIRIDSFSQGSVLVDYVVELNDLKEKLSTQQLKLIFHDALRAESPDADEVDDMAKAPMKLGKFTIDPKSTDFVVIPRVAAPKMLEDENRLIPQWAIAVIVIGVGGLLFIIVFGVSVLVNRQHGSKLKPSISAMYDEEVSKHTMSHHNAPMATPPSRPPAVDYNQKQHHDNQAMWNDSGWHDKPFESTSHKILVDGLPYERKYNMYDSWKSGQLDEWNGYYHPPTQASGSNFSRHYPDYDINF